MNRQEKRQLQRQGDIDPTGQPVATRGQQPRISSRAPATARATPLTYLRGVRSELRKVAWPNRTEVRNYSIVVLITLAVLGTLIFLLDTAFSQAALFLFR